MDRLQGLLVHKLFDLAGVSFIHSRPHICCDLMIFKGVRLFVGLVDAGGAQAGQSIMVGLVLEEDVQLLPVVVILLQKEVPGEVGHQVASLTPFIWKVQLHLN